MSERVFVISDLHLGGEPGFQLVPPAGQASLAAFIRRVTGQHSSERTAHLVLAGDIVDFLAETPFAALTTDEGEAVRKLSRILADTAVVWDALAAHVRAGAPLSLLLGNHDIELSLPASRRLLLERLGHGAVNFLDDDRAWVRGPLLIEHGNRYDGWNAVDHDGLRRLRAALSRREEAPTITIQPGSEMVATLMASARQLGFESTNVDLIYGLPKQTPESLQRTVSQVAELRPERIALYSYAHLPQRFKPQRRIDTAAIPPAADKVRMLSEAIAGFVGQGYQYIGMDHFALPGDSLAAAKRQGRLHRNFQGYSTQPDCDLIGLGVSSIGRVGATYSQNAKTLDEYYDAVNHGEFPVVRGLALTREDLLRRAVIMAIMCQGRLEFESIELAHLIDFRKHFAAELEQLRAVEASGLVELEPSAIQVTLMPGLRSRNTAMRGACASRSGMCGCGCNPRNFSSASLASPSVGSCGRSAVATSATARPRACALTSSCSPAARR